MIDEKNKIIYVDYSTLATSDACLEKCRLQNVIGWKPLITKLWFPFGHAMHAAVGGYYDALAGGWFDEDEKWHWFDDAHTPRTGVDAIRAAQTAFLRSLKYENATIPVNLESEERRSVERGLGLVEAYIHRWRNEPYENVLNEHGIPYSEFGFRYDLATYAEYRIVYVGFIDRLMRNFTTRRPVIFERKTTTLGLSEFIKHVKPNHQVTGYFPPVLKILPDVRDCVWDCIFISDRKADMTKALKDRFWMWGIDVDKDFARQTTARSSTDITEFKFDAEARAINYAKWLMSGAARWPRSAPGACHAYGGCAFRNKCSKNFDDPGTEQAYMETFFKIDKWEPWKKITEKLGNV